MSIFGLDSHVTRSIHFIPIHCFWELVRGILFMIFQYWGLLILFKDTKMVSVLADYFMLISLKFSSMACIDLTLFILIAQDLKGVGNIFAFVLFISPIPTFRRIIRNQSTEQFSGLPYIYSLLNCLICLWYGLPIIMPDIILVATVNSIGAVFQTIYVLLFIVYADKAKKARMMGWLLTVLSIFAIIVVVSLKLFDPSTRQIFVGYLSVATLISMFASPLFIIRLVIRTKSVEYMPFYLSLSTFLMSVSFFSYGMLKKDPFIYVPNGIGTVLGSVQLLLFAYYCRRPRDDSREPLIA